MAIKIGTVDLDQSTIYVGSQEISEVYVGANKVLVDAPAVDPNAFIMRISVTAGQTITIPFYNTTGYNGVINWKDGATSTITTYNDADSVHSYAAAGDYDIEFTGTFKGFYFNNTGSKAIVKKIIQWGNIGMSSTANAFSGSNLFDLGDFENSNSITSLNINCFYNCTSLTSVTIPSSVTSLSNGCFASCTSLTSVTIPNSVASLGVQCFYNCTSLTSVTIPNSITSLILIVFGIVPSLTSVTIPSSVTSLNSGCFATCTSLTSVTIPNSVASLGNNCFYYCTSMLSYYFNSNTPPTLGSSALSGATDWKIYVPAASVATYKATAGWSNYATRIVAQ